MKIVIMTVMMRMIIIKLKVTFCYTYFVNFFKKISFKGKIEQMKTKLMHKTSKIN